MYLHAAFHKPKWENFSLLLEERRWHIWGENDSWNFCIEMKLWVEFGMELSQSESIFTYILFKLCIDNFVW